MGDYKGPVLIISGKGISPSATTESLTISVQSKISEIGLITDVSFNRSLLPGEYTAGVYDGNFLLGSYHFSVTP
jgi:hypothetical protein